ncbi:MAG TPA: acyl-CoA dehydrogenase family protein [Actinomycetota bacterium]
MDFDFSPDQYALRDEARRFLAEQCPTSHVRGFTDDTGAWSKDLWKRMADLGWMALPFPEQHGGLGQSPLDLVLLVEELGRAIAPVPFLSSVAFAGQAILRHGSDEQRARLLPSIAAGDRVACLAIADDADTFDEARVTCRAEPAGEGWRLSGEKRYVLDAPAADLFIVAARAGDEVRWFAVDEPAAVHPKRAYDRTRTMGSVVLDGTPAEALAVPGLQPALRVATGLLCAEMVGTAGRILEITVEYAGQRQQFGRPIGSFQAIKHKCAEMATELEAARAAAYYACWASASDAPDAEVAASIAKSYISDAFGHLGGEGVQIHGGIAFTWEHDMHLYLRRLKTAQVLLGDASYHRERIAQLAGL